MILFDPLIVDTAGPCCGCGIETDRTAPDFRVYVCSEPCMRLMLAGFWAAERAWAAMEQAAWAEWLGDADLKDQRGLLGFLDG